MVAQKSISTVMFDTEQFAITDDDEIFIKGVSPKVTATGGATARTLADWMERIDPITRPTDTQIDIAADTLRILNGEVVGLTIDTSVPAILSADGSEEDPSYSFVDDPDSGMFSAGADDVGIAAGGSSCLRVTGVAVEGLVPLKVPSYTVAGAPSAATAGAGAAIYVTDGDAGSACLAVSDGSDWKVVALGVTISAT